MDKEIEKLANEISFRLLATKDHPDYEWLKEILKKWKNTSTEENQKGQLMVTLLTHLQTLDLISGLKKRIRYSGIDTWESRTRNLEEKAKGLEAKARN